MGFAWVDIAEKRHWMSEGNVRSYQDLQAQGASAEIIEAFLVRNVLSITTPEEQVFEHPFNTPSVTEQRGPGFEGVPATEQPVEEAVRAAAAKAKA